jgi:PKD repeat protein
LLKLRIDHSPENPVVNQTITFNASSSYDPDGNITNYEWDFGDGEKAEGKIVTHSYSSVGNYTVKLTMRDDDEATNSTAVVIQILESSYLTLFLSEILDKQQESHPLF